MSQSKHTPGPWTVELEADHEEEQPKVYVCSPDTQCDVTVVATMGEATSIPQERKIANARLIAAAPDLLEALKLAEGRLALLLDVFPQPDGESDHPTATRYVLAKAIAAIAKATGAQP